LGKQQHYELGQWLHKRYAGLVNETYSRNEIYIRSTDVDRTLMSALSNLDGFYPPVGGQVWKKDANWQPIPVHTVPEKSDAILAAKKSCPSYDYALKKLKQSDEYVQFNKQHKKLYDYLTLHTGRTVGSMEAVQMISNCLFIEELYNRT
jgi:lysosomal acid phosphatase